MMPGVVAGFPMADGIAQITVTSERESGSLGPGILDVYGYDIGAALGSMAPDGASGIPGASHVPGANGEILHFSYERHSSAPAHQLFVVLRGSYASVPFASVKIGSLVIGGFSVFYQESSRTYFRTTAISANPIPAGPHAITFT